MADEPICAFFRHPDGSWYRLWVTHTEPRTPRGHIWHVHASYDKSGTTAPVAGLKWFEQSYGMANWDFDTRAEAIDEFRRRAEDRLDHGYELREGDIPPASAQGSTAVARGGR
ncbi:MAG TPA: hypothetical protein VGF55_14110 [Gemmataceae bacterium]|jgi:hypothetical protein